MDSVENNTTDNNSSTGEDKISSNGKVDDKEVEKNNNG